MARKGKIAEGEGEPATLPLKRPEPKMDRLKAIIAAAGFPPDAVEINSIGKGRMSDGTESVEYQLTFSLTPEQMERFNQMFDVKVHDPNKGKDTINIGKWEVTRVTPPNVQNDEEHKAWAGKERRRRKPKDSQGPDRP